MNKFLLILLVCAGLFTKATASIPVLFKDTLIQKTDTLNIMISTSNHIYYYDEPLQPDASNFHVTNSGGIRNVIQLYSDEVKEKDHKLIILLKIQKQSSLNASSKYAMEFIIQRKYKEDSLKEVEKELIRITEGIPKD